MARRIVLLLLLFLVFIWEGTIVPWLIPDSMHGRLIPHLTYILILFVAIYYHRHTALVLGLIFGLLQDVVFYGDMIGAYAFAMGLSAYVLGLLFQSTKAPYPLMMTVVLIGSLLLDHLLYGIYLVFGLTRDSYAWALGHYMFPNLLLHFVFALLICVPVRRQLEEVAKLRRRAAEEE
ncbi:rod shape-determining protein MreD [Paenibacillus campi]|uniref:rod shape-determining protein MreD n=1 Tax=Paenibacillus campi TaxID=3106031 RepID=UPI002AFF9871|nr:MULTISPECIES: rod shape-determining protein MreD [unclassified Paenibacillus]